MEERVFQNITEVIYIDEKQDWAQHTALGNSSLHWERGGEALQAKQDARMCKMPEICPRRQS